MVVKAKNFKVQVEKDNGAPLSRRFIAYLIDWYVGALATAFPIAITSQKLYNTMLNQYVVEFEAPFGLIAGIAGLVCAFLYFVIVPTYVTNGQTLGKRICKIKVVQESGKDVKLSNMLLRQVLGIAIIEGVLITASAIWHQVAMILTGINFVTPLMYVGFAIGGLSVLLVLFKGNHRAIHDYIGKTKVISCQ